MIFRKNFHSFGSDRIKSADIYIYIYIWVCVCVCVYVCVRARGVMGIVEENRCSDPSSNSGQGCFISHSVKALGKDMNPTILPLTLGK